MRGYIQDQSIVLTEGLPEQFANGDEVEIVIQVVNQPQPPFPTFNLGIKAEFLDRGNDYQALAQQWDAIPDTIAAQLKAEFADDDQAFAETTTLHTPIDAQI
jgi:hypothetical protein